MSERKTRSVSTKNATNGGDIADAQIAVRAYERWMGRGCPVSDGFDDWIAARRELEAELGARAARRSTGNATTRLKAPHSPASIH